ncbi:MAG TPA: hypothetical protein PLN21_13770 [Gemmatales bacterium]|nr:hypothetical protein [Gemmatales bacterium]
MIAMAAGAIYFANDAIRYNNKLESWITATPAEFPVDLSQPGEYEGALELISTRPCKLTFFLKLHSNQSIDRSALKGLSGNVRILDDPTDPLHILPLINEYYDDWPENSDHILTLVRINPWNVGKYRMRVSVRQGAEKLKDIKQTFVVKYELCGLEYWPDYIGKGVVIIFGLACLIIGLYLYTTRPILAVVLEPEHEPV